MSTHTGRLILAGIVTAGFLNYTLFAQSDSTRHGFEVSTGLSLCIYQSVVSMDQSTALETSIRGIPGGPLNWQAGFRFGLSPVLAEAFIRGLATMRNGNWQPAIGLELGYTRRAHFSEGKKLMRELRDVTGTDISPVYAAVTTAPLSFLFGDRWRFSFLELQVGTHLSHIGRTMRVQVGVITAGVTL